MLNEIRKISHGLIVRLLLGALVLAFIGWGIGDVLRAPGDRNLVAFADAENITENEFIRARASELDFIRKQFAGKKIPPEISKSDLNEYVLRNMVRKNLFRYLASLYDLDFSAEAVLGFIKTSPFFLNSEGKFDPNILRSFLRNSGKTEEEYFLDVKNSLIEASLTEIFAKSAKPPKILKRSLWDYRNSSVNFTVFSIDLKSKDKNFSPKNPSYEEKLSFYEKNKNLFTIPEKRSFRYIKTPLSSLRAKIKVGGTEIREFYESNKEYFGDKFDSKKIEETLRKEKSEELLSGLLRGLEDSVAGGTSLKEIASNYSAEIYKKSRVSYASLSSSKELGQIADQIFELSEKEISYPAVISEGEKEFLFIAEIDSLEPEKIEFFKEVENKVKNLLTEKNLKEFNSRKFYDLAAKAVNDKNASFPPNISKKEYTVARSSLDSVNDLPKELAMELSGGVPGYFSKIYTSGDKLYIGRINSFLPNASEKEFTEKEGSLISKEIAASFLEGLLVWLAKNQKIKINYDGRALSDRGEE